MKLSLKHTSTRLLLLSSILLFLSCSKDDVDPKVTKINTWIEEVMREVYYWEDRIPTQVNKSVKPDVFFDALLYKAEDRFSWIQENYVDLLNSLNGISKEAGFDFILKRDSQNPNNVVGQIIYVKKNSPASATALKRGDKFSKINGTQLTIDNYNSVLGQMDGSFTLTYSPIDVENEKFLTETIVSLNSVVYSENPNFLSTVIGVGEHKIGYYVYNFFDSGLDSTNAYDKEMDNVFSKFKSEGITDLVLDLRYNRGGSDISTINLVSSIAPNVDTNSIFYKSNHNQILQEFFLKDTRYGDKFLTKKFLKKEANISNMLMNKTLYVITSGSTASASELLINGLRPYMKVYLIGDTTAGKNVGSYSFYDDTDPENKWGLQPICFKVQNSLGQSDYTFGFSPDIFSLDNGTYLYPLGNPKEKLLSLAIGRITGVPVRLSQEEQMDIVPMSLSLTKRGYGLYVEGVNLNDLLKKTD